MNFCTIIWCLIFLLLGFYGCIIFVQGIICLRYDIYMNYHCNDNLINAFYYIVVGLFIFTSHMIASIEFYRNRNII